MSIKNLNKLMHSKTTAEANVKEIYGDDTDDQDASECLGKIVEHLNWTPLRLETSNSNGTFVHVDSRIAINIHGKKTFQESLDTYFKPKGASETQKILSEPPIIFVQLVGVRPDNSNNFSFPKNSIVYLPCKGKNVRYRINGFIYHTDEHYIIIIRKFKDPEGSKRWIHCDDSNITETVFKPEHRPIFLSLEKCD
ncbi:MAG: ubiquitin carboxyl-terminal hydrolase [Parachlamydia sp.]|nr:ubiquitin carboxyl-terminal hydrolase [Parachlamydia sp.]